LSAYAYQKAVSLVPACQHVLASVPPHTAGIGIVMCLPLFGICLLFYMFARWHRGFHRRMTGRS
jgi:hypothetical protein